MRTVAPISELEQRLVVTRADAPGTAAELEVLVELASRMVRDPQRRAHCFAALDCTPEALEHTT